MKYIIMCGGVTLYNIKDANDKVPKPFRKIYGERLIDRTIRQLRENNIEDIAISSLSDIFDDIGVPILKHDNAMTWDGYVWLHAFYPMTDPACYLYGDVFYSDEAIRTIIQTETNDVEFFASAPPFSKQYNKRWAEPFAFKVVNTEWFFFCVKWAQELHKRNKFKRPPISWELWQLIKGTTLNEIDYTNYTAINDFTVDIDGETEAKYMELHGFGKPSRT